jgi:hypothetical protein
LEEVMIKVFEGIAFDVERDGLSAQTRTAFPQRNPVTSLAETQRRGKTGNATANDADVLFLQLFRPRIESKEPCRDSATGGP